MTLDNQDTSRLCRGFAVLLHAGIGLADGAFLLAREEQPPLGQMLQSMGQQLDEGTPLADAMENSGLFPSYVAGLVRIGQETGRVEEALNALADYYEEQYRAACQIRSAVAYPSMLLVLMLAVVGVLLVRVLPVFDRVYASLGARMTGAAAGLLYLGQLLRQALPVLFGALCLLISGAVVCRIYPPFRQRLGAFLRQRFGDRGIPRKFNNARFARGLAMGLGSGLTLEGAVDLAGGLLSGIPQASSRYLACRKALEEGASIRDAMEAGQLLSPAMSRMLSLGMQGGSGDSVMEEIARQMMEEAWHSLDEATARVEPAMVLVSSGLVGLILLAVMLPLMDILSVIG